MGKNSSYTSKERRGILGVAVVALIVSAAGFILPRCDRDSSGPSASDAENEMVVLREGNIDSDSTESGVRKKKKERKKKTSGRKRKKKKSGKKEAKTPQPPRNPLEEAVPMKDHPEREGE